MTTAVVTGGAGFLGSHLCTRLVHEGWKVVCLDSLITGNPDNVEGLGDGIHFEAVDVTTPLKVAGSVDWVCHLASPASPQDYLQHPIETLKVGAMGTFEALELARRKDAAFFLASTSEVYGDPEVHPQPESYWGNVNPVGPRSVYDEAKRYSEAATMAYQRTHALSVRIVRIFNTYGPRMRAGDGRAVPNFIYQALNGLALTVHGDGSQTRSLCYVDDLIEGFWRLMHSGLPGPENLGNPEEHSMLELGRLISELAGGVADVQFLERPVDDPARRRPDITLAREELGWEPLIPLKEGLGRTILWASTKWLDKEPP